jgi:hypothetical protein
MASRTETYAGAISIISAAPIHGWQGKPFRIRLGPIKTGCNEKFPRLDTFAEAVDRSDR